MIKIGDEVTINNDFCPCDICDRLKKEGGKVIKIGTNGEYHIELLETKDIFYYSESEIKLLNVNLNKLKSNYDRHI